MRSADLIGRFTFHFGVMARRKRIDLFICNIVDLCVSEMLLTSGDNKTAIGVIGMFILTQYCFFVSREYDFTKVCACNLMVSCTASSLVKLSGRMLYLGTP